MSITKDDFVAWKHSAVTEAFIQVAQDNIDRIQHTLGGSAGLDPLQDRYFAGYIAGMNEFLNMRVEDVEVSDE